MSKLHPTTKPVFMNYYAHPTAVIDEGAEIGENSKIWHFVHIMSGVVIGADCILGQNVMVAQGVKLGRNVKVQNNVSLYTGVICEDNVFIGPSAVFTNVTNPRSAISRKHEYKQTLVREGASIGANATIVCGNEIGRFALIGAGSVITHPVNDYALVIGNPGRQVGWVSEFGHRLNFEGEEIAYCPESGEKYRLNSGQVQKIVE